MIKVLTNKKKTAHFFLVFFALLHLSLIATFIWTNITYTYPTTIGRWLPLYMDYIGSNRDYSFFAPSVANATRAICVVNNSSGIDEVYNIGVSDRSEAYFRFDCIISSCLSKAGGMDMFSHSWATFYLSHHPHATDATIISQVYQTPSMYDYRTGKRPYWITIYTGTFRVKPPAGKNEQQ